MSKTGAGVNPAVDGVGRAIPFQLIQQAGFAHAAGARNGGNQPHLRVVFGAMKMEPGETNFLLSAGK
ncbi:MAG: hypothetical protein EHM12_12820 [Dehalococcoidia bacterium]|nr:MAG: hypothetical protein EHM12_12820 [Dehalococcoidia bacterium]